MTLMMTAMNKAGKTAMGMALLQGAMFTGDPGKAKGIGLFTHLVMMSAIVFGSIYAVLFSWLDTAPANAWWVGALAGVVHGIVAGLAMAMIPAMHPRVHAGASVHGGAHAPVELAPPGLFAKNYGAATVPGIVMAHAVYGLVVGLVYALLAS